MPVAAAKRQTPADAAPRAFRRIWNWVVAHRGRRSSTTLAKQIGIVRSTWFEYQRHGSIPFNKLEHLVNLLGGSIDADVVPAGVSGVQRKPSPGTEAEPAEDDVTLDQLFARIALLPDRQQGIVQGKLEEIVAAQERAANPSERVADHRGNRGSSGK